MLTRDPSRPKRQAAKRAKPWSNIGAVYFSALYAGKGLQSHGPAGHDSDALTGKGHL